MKKPVTKRSARRRKRAKLSSNFTVRFWEDSDGRLASIKAIKRRVEALRKDVGATSVQKDLLVQRAAFVALQLESMEIAAAEGKELDRGVYGQMVNTLLGLLRALGLESAQRAKAISLKDYVAAGVAG